MHYPWWYVPHATSPMLIAIIAVVHVVVSHYAVGGGFFLAMETGYAYRRGDRDYLAYLRRHARFFVLVTVVFGAITGVGIWWTIGLSSPLATELLIRTFVFGWAVEYVAFIIEIVSGFIFLYYFGKLPERTHVAMAWIYAAAAWISLVIITPITSFMLHPGGWTPESNDFWRAVLNPQALPQIVSRTGGALLLSSLYVYVHSSFWMKDKRLHGLIQQRSARPALLGAAMITLGGIGWYALLPESAKAVLASAAVLNVFIGLIFVLTVAVFVLLYVGPYRNPGWLTPGFALALLFIGIGAFSISEFIRESVRKPYIVYNLVFGNQIYPNQVESLRRDGYLEGGLWTRAHVAARYPQAVRQGRIDEAALVKLPEADRVHLGGVLFQYHCNDCHAAVAGYSAVAPLLRGYSRPMIRQLVGHLEVGHFFMPPWAGTPEEADLLTEYLASIAPPRPAGMAPTTASSERR